MALSTRVFCLLGLALLGLGLILHIVGLATPEWSVRSTFNTVITEGLWRICFGSKCDERSTENDKIQAAGAFAIIAMLLGAAALALDVLHFVMGVLGKFQNRFFLLGALAACIAALASVLISVIIWGAGVHDSSVSSLGYSFALCIVGGLLIAAGGVLVFRGSN